MSVRYVKTTLRTSLRDRKGHVTETSVQSTETGTGPLYGTLWTNPTQHSQW